MLKKLFLASLLFCGGCASLGASGPSLEERVDQQDIQLRRMRPQQAETLSEVQAMRQEINELKGQLADLNSAGGARALADRVRQHDAALRQVDSNMALNLDLGSPMLSPSGYTPLPQTGSQAVPISQGNTGSALPAPVSATAAAPAGIAASGAPDSSAYMTAPSARVPASPASSQGNYGLPPEPAAAQAPAGAVAAPTESTWGQADPKPVLVTPKKDISLALLDSGINDYNARNYTAAERSFNDFIKNYPDHSQIAEARYYLAECAFQRNNFPDAAIKYDVVITKYPKSSNAPGAYLKQGIAFSKMGQKDAAAQRLRQLISKFPNSPEAARAKAFLKNNK